jgi:CP family cyanate transporter-like MFS transporter
LGLLWLAGTTMRITIQALPPVIPLIRDELRMSETEVGLLVSLPMLIFALAAVPGALLIARWGAVPTMVGSLLLVALAAAARAAAPDVALLLVATLLMGGGIAVIQPAIPTLVREWLPRHVGLGAAVSSNGIMVGVTLGPVLTIPIVLPLVRASWRLDLVLWALPVLATAIVVLLLAPRAGPPAIIDHLPRWWPDWKNPLVWLLGLTMGSNNGLFFGINAFLPDYLVSIERADLIGAALGWMNGCQLIASVALLLGAERLQRRAWPYLVFGPGTLAGVLGVLAGSGGWIVAAAGLIGFSLTVIFVVILALPPVLSRHGEVHHLSAGMFTVSYSFAVTVPVISGALWDLTGRPWTAFIMLGVCAVNMTVLGLALTRHARASRP